MPCFGIVKSCNVVFVKNELFFHLQVLDFVPNVVECVFTTS
jgi:hypothetical protein